MPPPIMTEGINPSNFAAKPDSKAPISLEELIKIVLTEATRVLNINQFNQNGAIPNPEGVALNFLAGVINAEDEVRFNRNIFRTSRVNYNIFIDKHPF